MIRQKLIEIRRRFQGAGKKRSSIRRIALKALLVIAVLGVCALPAVFMNSIYGYFPLLLALSLLLLSGLSLLLLRRGLRVETQSGTVTCTRGEHVDLGLRLLNDSFLVCPDATAVLTTSDLFGGPDLRQELRFSAAPRSSLEFGMGITMRHIGVYEVGLRQLQIRDMLGFLSCRIPAGGQYTVSVLPLVRLPEELTISDPVVTESASDTGTAAAGGMDYTGVREYAPGDPMKQIHWKLSAHSRDYLTKLQEQTLQQEYSIIPDFVAPAGLEREQLMDLNDTIIETALSLVTALVKKDMSVYLVYCDRTRTVVKEAAGRSDYMELLQRFAMIQPETTAVIPDGGAILEQGSHLQGRSSNVILVTSRITEVLLQELQAAARRGHNAALYLVVPAEFTKREIEGIRSRMNVLDDAGIACWVIPAIAVQAD